MNRFIIIFFTLGLLSITAQAQRQIPGQYELTAGGTGWMSAGGEIGLGFIGSDTRMIVRFNAVTDKDWYVNMITNGPGLSSSGDFQSVDILSRNVDYFFSFGYYWNILKNRSRSLSLWAGAALDQGMRTRKPVLGVGDGSIPKFGYLYGVSPELEFEVAVAPSVSLSFFARPRLQFFGNPKQYRNDPVERWFYPQFGLKCHVYVFAGR